MLTVQNAMPRNAGFEQALCANMNGVRLHLIRLHGVLAPNAKV